MKNPPETYDVTITVSSGDGKLTLKMPGIKRADILAPEYQSKGITAAVRMLEESLE